MVVKGVGGFSATDMSSCVWPLAMSKGALVRQVPWPGGIYGRDGVIDRSLEGGGRG